MRATGADADDVGVEAAEVDAGATASAFLTRGSVVVVAPCTIAIASTSPARPPKVRVRFDIAAARNVVSLVAIRPIDGWLLTTISRLPLLNVTVAVVVPASSRYVPA